MKHSRHDRPEGRARRRLVFGGLGAIAGAIASASAGTAAWAAPARPAAREVHVFKSPYCGCCGAWVDHLREAGFAVKVTEVEDTAPTRQRLGMPARLGSCHTATVGGYVIEGHVPAAEISRLLAGKPQALGLSVPGMPIGSPGMESGSKVEPYKVLLVAKDGRDSVFASYPR